MHVVSSRIKSEKIFIFYSTTAATNEKNIKSTEYTILYTLMLLKYRIIVEMIMILGETLANFVMYLGSVKRRK